MKLPFLLLFIFGIQQALNQQQNIPNAVINVNLNNRGELIQQMTFPTITDSQASLAILKSSISQQSPFGNSQNQMPINSAIQDILNRAQQVPGLESPVQGQTPAQTSTQTQTQTQTNIDSVAKDGSIQSILARANQVPDIFQNQLSSIQQSQNNNQNSNQNQNPTPITSLSIQSILARANQVPATVTPEIVNSNQPQQNNLNQVQTTRTNSNLPAKDPSVLSIL